MSKKNLYTESLDRLHVPQAAVDKAVQSALQALSARKENTMKQSNVFRKKWGFAAVTAYYDRIPDEKFAPIELDTDTDHYVKIIYDEMLRNTFIDTTITYNDGTTENCTILLSCEKVEKGKITFGAKLA